MEGPVKFVERRYNGTLPQLVYNPYSWTQVRMGDALCLTFLHDASRSISVVNHLNQWVNRIQMASIIFVDSPVGSGFSYARDPRGYDVGDISSSLQILTFLRKVEAQQSQCVCTVHFS
jgi:serine carboxypeptidase-like clade 1